MSIENPQDQNHIDIPQSPISREGLLRTHRQSQEQEPPRQGTSPSPNQGSQGKKHRQPHTMLVHKYTKKTPVIVILLLLLQK